MLRYLACQHVAVCVLLQISARRSELCALWEHPLASHRPWLPHGVPSACLPSLLFRSLRLPSGSLVLVVVTNPHLPSREGAPEPSESLVTLEQSILPRGPIPPGVKGLVRGMCAHQIRCMMHDLRLELQRRKDGEVEFPLQYRGAGGVRSGWGHGTTTEGKGPS